MSLNKPGDFPRWATNLLNNGPLGSQNRTEPDETKKDSGWNAGERPARNFANWLQWLNNEWITYFDKQWDTAGQVNFNFSQNLITTTGLTFGVDAGTITFDGVESTIASTTLILNPNSTTVIGFNLDALTIAQYTSGGEPTSDFVKLFVVTTDATSITNVDDRRTFFQVQSRLQSGDNKLIIDGATDTFEYTNNGVSIIYASNAGNIGINTANPFGKLHVRQGASGAPSISGIADGIIIEDSVDTGISIVTPDSATGTLSFSDTVGNAGGMSYSHAVDKLSMHTGGTNKISVDSTGKVAISDNSSALSPLARVHVSTGTSGASSLTADGIFIENDGDAALMIGTTSTATGSVIFADPQSSTDGGLQYNHANSELSLRAGDVQRVFVNGTTGNLGVGVSGADAKVHIKQGPSGYVSVASGADGIFIEDSNSTGINIQVPNTQDCNIAFGDPENSFAGGVSYLNAGDVLALRANGVNGVTLNSSGNVGINTLGGVASARLHVRDGDSGANPLGEGIFVENSGDTYITVGSSSSANGGLIFADTGSNVVGSVQYSHLEDKLHLGTNGTLDVTIDSAGKTGFGTQSPLGHVHVHQGSSGVSSINAGADGLLVEDSGTTGITIATPNTVEGNLLFADPQSSTVGGLQYNNANDVLALRAGDTQSVFVTSSGLGVGTSTLLAKTHIKQASSGAGSVTAAGNLLVLESSVATGLSILTPNTVSGNVLFGDPENSNAGSYTFNHADDTHSIQIAGVAKVNVGTTTTTVTNNLSVSGDLTVSGNVDFNSATMSVDDNNITLNNVASPNDTNATGGGITIKGDTDKTISWAAGDFNFSENIDLASGKTYQINDVDVLSATTLGSSVVNSSLTSVGTITSGTWNGTAIANANLANSSLTVNGTSISLGSSGTVTADAGTLTGTTLNSSVTASSLTSVGTLGSLSVTGNVNIGTGSTYKINSVDVLSSSKVSLVNNTDAYSVNLSRTSAVARDWSLGIDGDGGFRLTDASNSIVTLSAIPSGGTFLASQGELVFKYNSSTEGMRLDSSGRLGIGLNAPQYRLDVLNNAAAITARIKNSNATSKSGVQFDNYVSTASGSIYYDNNDAHFKVGGDAGVATRLRSNGTDQVILDTSGNVGIGVAPSAGLLHTRKTGADNITYLETVASGNPILSLSAAGIGGTQLYQDRTSNSFRIKAEGGADRLVLDSSGNVDIRTGTLFLDSTGTNNGVINNPASIRINIDSNNNGTTESFTVGNNQSVIDDNNVLFRVMENGNVGIGVASPLAKAHIYQGASGVASISSSIDGLMIEDAVSTGITIATPNTLSGFIAFADPDSNVASYLRFNHSSDTLTMRVQGNDILNLVSNNAGVGTPSPLGKLHVKSGASNLTVPHFAGSELIVEGAGETGITISTTSAFNGHIYFSDLANQNTEVGLIRYSHSTDTMDFWTAGASRVSINSTGQLVVKDGTAGSPGITFASDTSLGIYYGGTDKISFAVNGTEFASISPTTVNGTTGQFQVASAVIGSDSVDQIVIGTISEDNIVQINSSSFPTRETFKVDQKSTATGVVARFESSNSAYTGSIVRTATSTASNTNYFHFRAVSNNDTDPVFSVYGNGQITSDSGSISTPGADYAEMFEWEDGNINNEDRVGYSVSLVNAKIKITSTGELPIGVISGAPTIIGDGHELSWSDKWLTDDFGRRILDENGNQQYSPDYDPTLEYIPRSKRKEWSPVGLMGKLVLRKGQVTAPNWIKLKDINENLELWLVR